MSYNDRSDSLGVFLYVVIFAAIMGGSYFWGVRQCSTVCSAQHASPQYLACSGCWCRKDGDLYNPADSR